MLRFLKTTLRSPFILKVLFVMSLTVILTLALATSFVALAGPIAIGP